MKRDGKVAKRPEKDTKRAKKATPGDVVAIPLGEGLFAFGRIYRDASIGVFDLIARRIVSVEELARSASERFVTGFFSSAIKDGSWKIIGRRPFARVDDEWPPPKRVNDIINPSRKQIYHRGAMRLATDAEVEGLEEASMSKPNQLVDRIRAEFASELKTAASGSA